MSCPTAAASQEFFWASCVSTVFWSLVDFGWFQLPSAGTLTERAIYARVTALGPLWMTGIEALRTFAWVICGSALTSVTAAILFPRNQSLLGLAYIAIFAWWFCGFGVVTILVD